MAGPVRKCPKCGKSAVERLISAGGGLIFKGSGFYITDYRDAAYQRRPRRMWPRQRNPTRNPTKKDAKPGEAKPAAETKPDAKTEAKTDSKTWPAF